MLARATRATWRRCALLFSSTSKSVPITAPASAGDRFTTRVSGINALTARGGWTPYPASFPTSISIPSLLERFAHLKPGEAATGETVSISGRIHARRDASSKLIFFDLQCGIRAQNTTSAPTADHSQSRVQIMLTAKQYAAANLDMVKETIRRGDVVGVKGHVCRTKTGELSVVPKEMTLLAPCLHQIPDELANIETRTRQRYLDLLVNRSAAQTFVLRRQMIRFMREYFDQRGFLEVCLLCFCIVSSLVC
jgi:lysyl-tRNA synthetase class 2